MKKLLFAATLALLCAGTRVSAQESPDWTGDLSPISAAEWDRDKARHLLARAGFGGTPAQADALAAMGLDRAVDLLVNYETQPNKDVSPDDFDRALMPPLTREERDELTAARRSREEATVERLERIHELQHLLV